MHGFDAIFVIMLISAAEPGTGTMGLIDFQKRITRLMAPYVHVTLMPKMSRKMLW